jgi:hypothetical protein
VIVAPPLEAGAAQETVAEVGEATTAVTDVGAPGGTDGVTAVEDGEDAEVPMELVAVIVKV